MARTSTAYLQRYLNNAVQLFSVGAGWPRCDVFYDAVRGLYLPGVHLEPERVNLDTYCSDFTNAIWTHGAGTGHTADTTVAPDGLQTADTVSLNGTGTGYIQQICPAGENISNKTFTSSFWLKLISGGPQVDVFINNNTWTAGYYSMEHKTLTSDWSKYSATVTYAAAAGVNTCIGFTANGLPAITVAVWCGQSEKGAYPSSSIFTVATPQTRTTDAPIVHTLVGDYSQFSLCIPFSMRVHTPAADTLICRLYKNGAEATDHVSVWYAQTTGQLKITSAATGGAAGLVTVPVNIVDDQVHYLHVHGRDNQLVGWVDWGNGTVDDAVNIPAVDRFEYSVSGGWTGLADLQPYFSRVPIRSQQPGGLISVV